MKTICVDFDGVTHSYTSPWQDAEIIPDPPVPGAFRFLQECLDEGFRVVILTSRVSNWDKDAMCPRDPEAARKAIENWFERHGFREIRYFHVTDRKCAAVLYIDDRGYQFTGSNFPRMEHIRNFKPWNK